MESFYGELTGGLGILKREGNLGGFNCGARVDIFLRSILSAGNDVALLFQQTLF